MSHSAPSRRALMRGVAWATPAIAVSAHAPAFAASQCGVTGGITVAPNSPTNFRAICTDQSQQSNPPSIKNVYGSGDLPGYIDVCSCDGVEGWYRWRETDTLSEFQIEVDGMHSDQNGPQEGYRPPIFLSLTDPAGSCQRFSLSYRTSVERSRTTSEFFSISWTLQRSTGGASGPWVDVETVTRAVSIIRTVGTNTDDQTDFDSCAPQGRARIGAVD